MFLGLLQYTATFRIFTSQEFPQSSMTASFFMHFVISNKEHLTFHHSLLSPPSSHFPVFTISTFHTIYAPAQKVVSCVLLSPPKMWWCLKFHYWSLLITVLDSGIHNFSQWPQCGSLEGFQLKAVIVITAVRPDNWILWVYAVAVRLH